MGRRPSIKFAAAALLLISGAGGAPAKDAAAQPGLEVVAGPPVSAGRTFNVRALGAVGDGRTKDTAAFQRALDACAGTGGEVVVPAGSYLIGAVRAGAGTTIRLQPGSVIVGSSDLADYPMAPVRWEGRWEPGHRALLTFENAVHSGIVGDGRIEGSPAAAAPQNPRGAVVLEAVGCRDLFWEGFTVTQGGNWAVHPVYCEQVTIGGLTIRGGRDGIDVDSCRKVRIERCAIDTGDDSISLKSGRGLQSARIGRPTEDVLIRDCVLRDSRFAAIGIGSETSGGIRRVRIERCRLASGRSYGIYIKTRTGRGGTIEDIEGEDLDVQGGGFLRINLASAGNENTEDDPVPGPAGLPRAARFRFADVRVRASVLVDASQILPEAPLEGLELADVSGTCARGIVLRNVRNAVLRNITVTVLSGPLLRTEGVTGSGLARVGPASRP